MRYKCDMQYARGGNTRASESTLNTLRELDADAEKRDIIYNEVPGGGGVPVESMIKSSLEKVKKSWCVCCLPKLQVSSFYQVLGARQGRYIKHAVDDTPSSR